MTKAELLKQYLEERGLHMPSRSGWQKVSCINDAGHPRGDRNPSASVNLTAGRYNCFGCGLAGDVFDLMKHFDGVDFATAKRMLGTMPKHTEPTWI